MQEIAVLFNYKGTEILIRKRKEKYQMGMRNPNGFDIWFDKIVYNSLKLARTSGREYARIVIDKILLSRKQ